MHQSAGSRGWGVGRSRSFIRSLKQGIGYRGDRNFPWATGSTEELKEQEFSSKSSHIEHQTLVKFQRKKVCLLKELLFKNIFVYNVLNATNATELYFLKKDLKW